MKFLHGVTNLDRIDSNGFRANVGIILTNGSGSVLLAGRAGQSGWQFPQGGILVDESPEQAMYRELREEIGLEPDHIEVLGVTREWLRYRLPERFIRHDTRPVCIGQKQLWYLLLLRAPHPSLRFDTTSTPEFDRWRWTDYWSPVAEVIYFKRGVYLEALGELAPVLFPNGPPPCPDWPADWRLSVDAESARAGP
jgi:putative (di)nucleoside polyphosphate hydrolase